MHFLQKRAKTKKVVTSLVIGFFVIQLFSPAFLFSEPAYAFADTEAGETAQTTATVTGDTKADVKETTKEVKSTILTRLTKGLILSASITLRNALVYASEKLAEQTINYIATGDWGQGGMFYEQAFDKFTDDLMNNTVGHFLDNLRDMVWSETGFDICNPRLPEVKISIMLELEVNTQDPGYIADEPDCTLSEVVGKWDDFGSHIKKKYEAFADDPQAFSLATLQEATDLSFSVRYTDIGQFLALESALQDDQQEAVKAETAQRNEGDGVKAKVNIAGQNIQTPAFFTKSTAENEAKKSSDAPKSEMESSKDVITDIPESIAAAFLGSLVSKAFSELIMKKLFDSGISNTSKSYVPQQHLYESGKQFEKEVAQAAKIKRASFSVSSKQIDLLTEFATCPDYRQINNCVIDGDFAQAVRAADQDVPLTLEEAIDAGYVKGGLPFIGPNDNRNNSDDCSELGWCYSNLTKLRKARIIPIGWELAASLVQEGESVTLQDAMDLFDYETKSTNKFWHLIDPDWVLRYPKTKCEASVFGPRLIAPNADKRAETCVDTPSCVKEDNTGKCVAYGYCAAEKGVYRFGGQECEPQFASCRSLKDRENQEVNYILKSTDKGGCSADTVGCQEYSLNRDVNNDWEWKDYGNTIYLNKVIDEMECDPEDDGCSRFIQTTAGLGTNLIKNGGFEEFEGDISDATNEVTGWLVGLGGSDQLTTVTDSFSGQAAVNLNQTSIYTPAIHIPYSTYTRYYAFSMKAKYTGSDPELHISGSSGLQNVSLESEKFENVTQDEWTTVREIYRVSPTHYKTERDVHILIDSFGGNADIIVDEIMFEQIDSPTWAALHEYNEFATKNAVYLKKAPEYFKCYDATNDAGTLTASLLGQATQRQYIYTDNDAEKTDTIKGCLGFAASCSANEVGCTAYSPTDGGDLINGVVNFSDYCPQQCVGYSSYGQSESYFADSKFPLYFIPSTADKCSAADVGCEEFTNLDETTQGAEAREYYSELRMCTQLPENASDCSAFYTWVTQEQAGYQLKSYNLKHDGFGAPAAIGGYQSADCNEEIFDAKTNPDCRQFYNEAGSVHYRLYSKTISCSEDCHPYRRTLEYENIPNGDTAQEQCEARFGEWQSDECVFYAIPSEGKSCSEKAKDCKEYRGNYSGDAEIVFEATFNDGNIEAFLSDNSGISTVYAADGSYVNATNLTIDPEQLYLMDGAYEVSFWIKDLAGNLEAGVHYGPYSGSLSDNKKVTITPSEDEWHYYSYAFTVLPENAGQKFHFGVYIESGPSHFQIDNVKITKVNDLEYLIQDSWSTPKVCDQDLFDNDLPQAQLGCREYDDDFGTIHFLKSFSSLCPVEAVGCEALIDTKNSLYPFEKKHQTEIPLADICNQDFYNAAHPTGMQSVGASVTGAGCAVSKTNGATDVHSWSYLCGQYTQVYTTYDPNTVDWDFDVEKCLITSATISEDSTIYLVVDEENTCRKTEKGCQEIGLPTYEATSISNSDVKSWDTLLRRIDPDTFDSLGSALCSSGASSCEEYVDDQGSKYFFKDPGEKVCEWKKGQVGSEVVDAWFVKGLEPIEANLCDQGAETDYYEDGANHMVWSTDLDNYNDWVGECEAELDKCTAFIDPYQSTNSVGQAYYYLDNEQIDRSCTGVSLKQGCALFNNTNDPTLKYIANVSYENSVNAKNTLVQPAGGTTATTSFLNNTNEIIKVVRDRTCANWYACKQGDWSWDPNQNKYVEVCTQVGLCDRLDQSSDSPKCANFVNAPDLPNNILSANIVLSGDAYQTRLVKWGAYDYSGYAITGMAPLQFYNAFDIEQGKSAQTTCGGVKSANPCTEDKECKGGLKCEKITDYRLVNKTSQTCENISGCASVCPVPLDKTTCRCLDGVCVKAQVGGSTFAEAAEPLCRAYPTETSPFPASVRKTQVFNNANTVWVTNDDFKQQDFGCYYREVDFGGGALTKYAPFSPDYSPQIPPPSKDGFCQDAPDKPCVCGKPLGVDGIDKTKDDGVYISTATMCSSPDLTCGMCMKLDTDEIIEYRGWQGYCLEEDDSLGLNNNNQEHPCLTWYPASSLSGLMDNMNNYVSAGYNPPQNQGALFCTSAAGNDITYDDADPAPDYVSHVTSYGYGSSNEAMPRRLNYLYTGDIAKWSYVESVDYEYPDPSISLEDIAGVVIKMNDAEHDDWPEDFERTGGTISALASDWYKTSYSAWELGNTNPPVTGLQGYYIPVNYTEDGDIYGETKTDMGNYVTSKGKLNKQRFYNDLGVEVFSKQTVRSGYENADMAWKDWSYWQVIWPGAANNSLGNYNFLFGDGSPEGGSYKSQYLFDGTGKNIKEGIYINPLSRSAWDTENFPGNSAKDTDLELDFYNTSTMIQHYCEGDTKGEGAWDNYFGIRLLFNEYGQYRGIWHSICDETGGPGWVGFRVFFIFKEKCEQLVNVSSTTGENKARTNKIYNAYVDDNVKTTSSTPSRKIVYESELSPMGSAFGYIPPNTEDGNSAPYENTPIGGTSSLADYLANSDNEPMYIPLNSVGVEASDNKSPGGSPYVGNYASFGGKPYGCIGFPCRTSHYTILATGEDDGVDAIKSYFANIYASWDWNKAVKQYQDASKTGDFSGTDADRKQPIVAAAINSGKTNSKGQPVYVAYPYRISVHNQLEGPIEITSSTYDAYVRFYAWAADDQMQIRNIKVFYGDGSSINKFGKYKNLKPRCQQTPKEKLGQCKTDYGVVHGYACNTDADCQHLYGGRCQDPANRFGDVTAVGEWSACNEGYFQHHNLYSCSPETLSSNCSDPSETQPTPSTDNEACRIVNYKGSGKDACRYTIKVQVKDNWEICNKNTTWPLSPTTQAEIDSETGYFDDECTSSTIKDQYEYYDGFLYLIP
jgi:hypothetical protein